MAALAAWLVLAAMGREQCLVEMEALERRAEPALLLLMPEV